MNRSKIDFILDILENRNLDQREKEKFLTLSSKELKSIGQDDKELWSEIRQIKKAISTHLDTAKAQDNQFLSSTNTDKNVERKHRPRDVAEFMSLFNQRVKFKYLTHPFDQDRPFSIKAFLNHAESVFWEKTKELDIPPSIWMLVKNFAFESKLGEKNDKGYPICWRNINDKQITEGWSKSPIVERLVEKQDQNSTFPFEVEEFKKLINQFRQVTRIKASQSEPQLLNYLNKIFDIVFDESKSNYRIKIDENKIRRADFYCHVRRLINALTIIAKEFKDAKKPNLHISFERTTEGDYRVAKLILCQVDSYPAKDLADIKEAWFGTKGSMGAIREYLFGYCNWSVETRVHDGEKEKDVRINILRDDDTPVIDEPTSEIIGFKHTLTFYYK